MEDTPMNPRANLKQEPVRLIFPIRRLRFLFISMLFLTWAGLILGRLFWIQVVCHKQFVKAMQRQEYPCE